MYIQLSSNDVERYVELQFELILMYYVLILNFNFNKDFVYFGVMYVIIKIIFGFKY